MMLLERGAVAALLGLILPLILPLASTAAGAGSPQQGGAGQAVQSARSRYDRNVPPEKIEPPPAKSDDDDLALPASERESDGDDAGAKVPDSATKDSATKDSATKDATTKAADIASPRPAGLAPGKKAPVRTPEQTPVQAAAPAIAPLPSTPFEKDSATLLQLVQDLKAELDKAGADTLSVVAVRKADEIQRVVKSLKERVREEQQVSQK